MDANLPTPGFYYHWKHDPKNPDGIFDHAYEFLGPLHDATLSDEQGYLVASRYAYRPLYESASIYPGKGVNSRPIGQMTDNVDKPEYKGPRFIRIAEPALSAKMEERKRKMYP